MKPAVFLDRDGTLIEDRGYICELSQVGFYPFAAAAVRRLNRAGFTVVVVSNQSAVARGICRQEQVIALHRQLQEHFRAQGAEIAAFYHCPFLADGAVPAFRCRSPLRKPEPGMLRLAAAELGLDLAASYMVGDSLADIEAGLRAGCRTVLVRTGKGAESESVLVAAGPRPDHVAADLAAAAEIIAAGLRGGPA